MEYDNIQNEIPNNKRSTLLKASAWLNIITAIFIALPALLMLFAKIEINTETYEYIYEGTTPDISYEEWSSIMNMFASLKIFFAILLLGFSALIIFFAKKQFDYAKIYSDAEFAKTKNLLIAILSLLFSNLISGILSIYAYGIKNEDVSTNRNYDIPSPLSTNNAANELEAKILKLKEMYAEGKITLDEYNEFMNKIDF